LPVLREVRDKYLNYADKPASTTLAVAGFAREGALLETEAVAVLPAKAPAKTAKSRSAPARGRPSKLKAGRRKRK
jgi:hypothetical protein